ncbi:MAG TPA: hypothetical protein VN257_08990, partial [Actinotalea sp.]|nr:hypothetical protein [Actinotalea sp.]
MSLDPRAPLDPRSVRRAVGQAVAERSRTPLGRLEVVPRSGSTSSDLAAAVRGHGPDQGAGTAVTSGSWPDRSVLVADHQVAGRGRAGRTWTTPPGAALTFSVLCRPDVPTDRLAWVPLLGGLAVVQALADLTEVRPVLKWPNDVLVPAAQEVPGWG